MAPRKTRPAKNTESDDAAIDSVDTGNIEARLATLRDDLATLHADMKALYGDVSDEASERATLAMKKAQDLADKAMALAEEVATRAHAQVKGYRDCAQDWAAENAEDLRTQVRDQPLTSLLIAGGVGAFLGAIFLRR